MRRIHLKESMLDDGFIGIWWYTPDKRIIGTRCKVDEGVSNGAYVHYSDTENHLTLWSSTIKANYPEKEAKEIIARGYKSFERGRVSFSLGSNEYEIAAGEYIKEDPEMLKEIREFYHLDFALCRYHVSILNHYVKVELTGNPAVDSLYYEGEF